MSKALIDTYSDEEFSNIVANSTNMTEITKKLGYAAHSGSNAKRIRTRIDNLKLSTDHLSLGCKRPLKRKEENASLFPS